jgi:hypothetical protein
LPLAVVAALVEIVAAIPRSALTASKSKLLHDLRIDILCAAAVAVAPA